MKPGCLNTHLGQYTIPALAVPLIAMYGISHQVRQFVRDGVVDHVVGVLREQVR